MSIRERKNVLRKHLTTCTFEEIADMCGVSYRTIQRDVDRWQKKGGYDQFLLKEFFELYGVIKLQDPRHAFDRICDLLRRRQDQIQPPQEDQVDAYELVWRKKDAKQTA